MILLNVFNPQEPQIGQSLFNQMHFIQQFDKVCHRKNFPLYNNIIKNLRGHKMALFGYYACLSCDLLLMPSRRAHTYTNVRKQNDVKKRGVRGPVTHIHLV